MVLFLRNKLFNFMLFWGDYYLRWWRLPIEEPACRKTDLGDGDYYLRNSGLPPSQYTGSHEKVMLAYIFGYKKSSNPSWINLHKPARF